MAGPSIVPDGLALERTKRAWARAHRAGGLPSNVAWAGEPGAVLPRIRRKPSRTLSGVAVVAVMTSPAACPHGRCSYCPGGPGAGTPQSYTGEEPSALRGAQYGYDPRAITEARLRGLEAIGHPTSKVEVIVMGGTFPARPTAEQLAVLRGVYEGLNGQRFDSLEEAVTGNERAAHRCVSLTVETRPDRCDGRALDPLLTAGLTRVEIGVECLDDGVLAATGRAHGSEEVVRATRIARDRGLKVAYHMMLGLPGMDPHRDLAGFRRLFVEADYRPDMLKIYPTLVIHGTPLHAQWQRGEYAPYGTAEAAELIARIKAELPPWVRIQRIQRDIPARLIAAGVRHGNLREIAQTRLREQGRSCPCLRCREVGRRSTPDPATLEMTHTHYAASSGTEHFLAFEDPTRTAVAGFLRLRIPSAEPDGGLDAPVIRELKALGPELPVGSGPGPAHYQHRGIGRALVARAVELAAEAGFRRLYVRSAVGTREYYRRLGFSVAGPNLVKATFA